MILVFKLVLAACGLFVLYHFLVGFISAFSTLDNEPPGWTDGPYDALPVSATQTYLPTGVGQDKTGRTSSRIDEPVVLPIDRYRSHGNRAEPRPYRSRQR